MTRIDPVTPEGTPPKSGLSSRRSHFSPRYPPVTGLTTDGPPEGTTVTVRAPGVHGRQ